MPQAYGTDRVTRVGNAFLITTTCDKGWTARHSRTSTSPEMPGTTVDWDGAMYEVVARNEAGIQVRYRLEPSKPSHLIRQMEHYDEASESRRQQQRDTDRKHYRIGRRLELFGMFTGHLPAEAQRQLNMLYGVSLARITLLSTIPLLLFGVYCARFLPIHDLPYSPPPFPAWVIPIGLYFFLESIVRLRSWLRGRPMGSAIGWIVFALWWIFGGRKVLAALEHDALRAALGPRAATGKDLTPPSAVPRPARDGTGSLPLVDADAERKLRDQYVLREPYIALLSIEEQRKVQQRFGFDPISQGKRTAAVLLFIAGTGAAVTIAALVNGEVRLSRLLSALVALGLVAEQIYRLTLLAAARPAPSILGRVVRPFLRKVLDAPPPQPVFEGDHRNAALPDVWDEEAEISPK